MIECTLEGLTLDDVLGAVRSIIPTMTIGNQTVGDLCIERELYLDFARLFVPVRIVRAAWHIEDGDRQETFFEYYEGETWLLLNNNFAGGVRLTAGFNGDHQASVIVQLLLGLERQWPSEALNEAYVDAVRWDMALIAAELEAAERQEAGKTLDVGTPQARPADGDKRGESEPPQVPGRPADLRRWQATWRYVYRDVGKGKSLASIVKWLETMHPELACTEDTLRRIVAAGKADLLAN